MFRSMIPFCVVILHAFVLSGHASEIWTGVGKPAQGFQAWRDQEKDYSPTLAIGASSLAFGPGEKLYLACEKYPDILVFDKNGSPPNRISLNGLQPGVDLEGMSICDNVLYLVNEDVLVDEGVPCLYSMPLNSPGTVWKFPLPEKLMIDTRPDDGNPTNNRSIEGLVVSKQKYLPSLEPQQGRTYLYLLDERDTTPAGDKVAKVYVGYLNGDHVDFLSSPIVFPLTRGEKSKDWFRLCELFEFRGKLYALKTLEGEYHVVELDMEAKTLRSVCDFTKYANGLSGEFDTNFEGAAVHPDGRLFLTADNENYDNDEVRAGGRTPLGPQVNMRGEVRKCTPLVCLPLKN